MDSEAGRRRTALVTGASSGIGLELARLLAADRVNLVLVARNAVRLEQLAEELQSERKISVRCLPTGVMRQVEKVGAIVIEAAQKTFWGGYAGYFTDPDGQLCEIMFNSALLPEG
jgi:short-subunit dehydrogenase